jgi:GNAT superfamily N-acetyltransferase
MPAAAACVADGARLRVRPVTVADRDRITAGFEKLSRDSRYRRFLGPKTRLSNAELTYLTDIDHRTHAAFAAVDECDGSFVGIARYAIPAGQPGSTTADLSVVVLDDWQGRGIGTLLAVVAVRAAAANGMRRLTGTTLGDNRPARALLRRLGFRTVSMGGGLVDLELELA